MSPVRRWGPTIAWGAAILLVTSIPGSVMPTTPVVPGLDKVVHLALYGTLGWLAGGAASAAGSAPGARRPIDFATALRALGAMACFAAADEWHQQFIPGRGADPLDWVADVAGAALGLALAALQTLTTSARARRETST